MKKSLVALAALAVVGAASAQSTVTMYGLVDLGVTSAKDSNSLGGGAAFEQVQTGLKSVLNGSRIGFKGTEDLGSGLKANFVMEFAVQPDEAASNMGTRTGTVGVSGGFGAVTLGRQFTPYHNVQAAMDLAGNIAAPGYIVSLHNRERASNSVTYNTPTISGFSGALMVAAGETIANNTGTGASGNSYGLAAVYAAGPLVAGFGYDSISKPGATAGLKSITGSLNNGAVAGTTTAVKQFGGANSESLNVWAAGASYDFSVVKASLAYSDLQDKQLVGNDIDSKGWNLSVAAPFGATTVYGNLGRANVTQTGTNDIKIVGYQLGANYALSKRTTAYAVYGSDKTEQDNVAGEYKRTQTSVGVRHTF